MTPIVIVTGAPGAGKSTLAHRLAADLRLPLLEKDAIKETLFESLGTGDREWSSRLGAASYDVLYTMLEVFLRAGLSVCLEANLPVDVASKRLHSLGKDYPVQALQIVCTASPQVIASRWEDRVRQRSRHPGHLDWTEDVTPAVIERWQTRHGPLQIPGRVIEVDTSYGVVTQYPEVLSTAQRHLQSREIAPAE